MLVLRVSDPGKRFSTVHPAAPILHSDRLARLTASRFRSANLQLRFLPWGIGHCMGSPILGSLNSVFKKGKAADQIEGSGQSVVPLKQQVVHWVGVESPINGTTF